MSALSTSLTDYLRLRASLGFKMKEATRELPQFLSFLDQQGARSITTKLAVQWAVRPKDSPRCADSPGIRAALMRGRRYRPRASAVWKRAKKATHLHSE
jgi:hypothetical protein